MLTKILEWIKRMVAMLFTSLPRAVDANGDTISGAGWHFYRAGTLTSQAVYTNASLTTPHTNPVVADSGGNFAPIYLDNTLPYRAILRDAGGATIKDIDPVNVAAAAAKVTFGPSESRPAMPENGDYFFDSTLGVPIYWNGVEWVDATGLFRPIELPEILPGSAWDGTAGTGFSTTPSDPTRTTAKPAIRLLVPPNQYFTDELVVGVFAAANNGGSLVNLGLSHVKVYFEGNTHTLTSPGLHSFNDVNGVSRTYLGWWITLKKPTATAGDANVYFEAVPADATMQNRVIGPYQFTMTDTLHDASVTVNSAGGADYTTLTAAYEALRVAGRQNPLVTITGGGPYDMLRPDFTYTVNNGYVTTIATTPVTIKSLTPYAGDNDNSILRPRVTAMCFRGDNITFDFVNTVLFNTETGARLWLDGVNVTNSGGPDRLYRGTLPNQSTAWGPGDTWMTECTISNIVNAAMDMQLVRGGTFTNCRSDLFDDSACVIGTLTTGLDNTFLTSDQDALTVQYTGSAGTATIELSGGAGSNNRVLTIKEDGTTIDTFTILNTNAGYLADTNYSVQDVVDWLNSQTDWTATLQSDDRAAMWLGRAGESAFAFPATDVKTAPLTLVCNVAAHGDYWQLRENSPNPENIIFSGNRLTGGYVQALFLSATTSLMKDAIFINNAFHTIDSVLQSQFGRSAHSHVVVAHNSWSQQQLTLVASTGYNPDAYCLVANNVAPAIVWAGTPDADLVIKDNHLFTGATTPSGATGTTIGGTGASLFVDASAGNFTPQGDLLTNVKTPVLERDQANRERAGTDAAGAVRV